MATLKYRSLPVAPAWSCMVEAPVRGCVQEARGTALEPMLEALEDVYRRLEAPAWSCMVRGTSQRLCAGG